MKVKKYSPEYQDINLIKLMLNRENYEVSRNQVDYKRLTSEAKTLLTVIGTIYRDTEVENIGIDTIKQYFIHAYPNMDDKHKEIYERVLDAVEEAEDQQIDVILRKMRENHAREQIEDIWNQDGFDVDQIQEVVDSVKEKEKKNLDHILELDFDGLHDPSKKPSGKTKWNLELFNEVLAPPDDKQLYVIGADPGIGKTAFLVDMTVSVGLTLPEDKQILWVNNEEPKKLVVDRWFARACDTTTPLINQYPQRAKEKYIERMGRLDKIVYMDSRDHSFQTLIDVISSREWGLIVIDMLSKIEPPSNRFLGRQDEKLEACCAMFRKLSQEHGTMLASYQANGSWKDQKGTKHWHRYLDQSTLHGTNIGIQGATENIITIGCDKDSNPTRYIYIAKAKAPGAAYQSCMCRLDFDRIKYED